MEDQEILQNLAEDIFPIFLEKVNNGDKTIYILNLITNNSKKSLDEIQKTLKHRSMHYRNIEDGVGNALIELLKKSAPHKKAKIWSMWGRDATLEISD